MACDSKVNRRRSRREGTRVRIVQPQPPQEPNAMPTQLIAQAGTSKPLRVRLSGANCRGLYRSGPGQAGERGTLVVEAASSAPSSVIAQIDECRALVRHVGTCDAHPARFARLRAFPDCRRMRVGADFADSGR